MTTSSESRTHAPSPYYEDAWSTIYHGDALETLDAIGPSAAATITDPPYATGYYATDTDVFDAEMLRELPGACAVFGWPERLISLCLRAQMVPDEWVTWWASNAAAKAPCLTDAILPREAECIAIFGQGQWRSARRTRRDVKFQFDLDRAGTNNYAGMSRMALTPDARLGDVWTDPSPGIGFNSASRMHPNQKPLEVLARLVEGLSAPGDVVLDPFMGSGTTLRAAKDLGRKSIGIEIEERYCEIAANRLAQEVLDFGGVA